MNKQLNFLGSLIVVVIAIAIFLLLMSEEMPQGNREILISFVSVLFGAMANSLKQITGVDNARLEELHKENVELKAKNLVLEDKISVLESQVNSLIAKIQ